MTSNENPLEAALSRAAREPAHRPELYRLLLDSTILVLGHANHFSGGATSIPAGASIAIQPWSHPDGSPVIPFFTSVAALQRAIDREERYIALNARSFFEITRGSTLVLNPRSDVWKEFLPREVEALLTAGVNQLTQTRVVTEPTQVLLGQPKIYPTALVSSLRLLLAKHPNVIAAYLAMMAAPSIDGNPHLIVGIEGDGNIDAAIRDAGAVAAEASTDNAPVDFVRVVRDGQGFNRYFLEEVKPFYSQPPKSVWNSLFGRN